MQTTWRVAAVTTLAVLALTGLQLALPRGALADTYERGVAALDAGRYDEALFHISLLAANDDPRAQYTMGVMYRRGLGVAQDDREALLWYLSAAEAGHMLGQYAAGLALTGASALTGILPTPCIILGKRHFRATPPRPCKSVTSITLARTPGWIMPVPISGGRSA